MSERVFRIVIILSFILSGAVAITQGTSFKKGSASGGSEGMVYIAFNCTLSNPTPLAQGNTGLVKIDYWDVENVCPEGSYNVCSACYFYTTNTADIYTPIIKSGSWPYESYEFNTNYPGGVVQAIADYMDVRYCSDEY